MDEIRVFSPATVSNVACGFDVLGFALESIGDQLVVRRTAELGLRISKITGQELTTDIHRNVAGVAVQALLRARETHSGFEFELHKGIKPGSGIGSSAASSTAAVWAVNELLGAPYTSVELVTFAMEGERLVSGTAHADNVAPALLGGFTLIRSYEPLDLIALPFPKELFAVVLHPQIEMKTADSRALLKPDIPLADATRQWGNLGGLIAGLYEGDYELIGRCLEDRVAESARAIRIPGYWETKRAAMDAGALGANISGSGPSIFALCKGKSLAELSARAMKAAFEPTGIPFQCHVSRVSPEGVRKIDES